MPACWTHSSGACRWVGTSAAALLKVSLRVQPLVCTPGKALFRRTAIVHERLPARGYKPLQLGVACVSVYAFSIDNYRRSGEEVTTLMALAEDKLAHLLQVSCLAWRCGPACSTLHVVWRGLCMLTVLPRAAS